LNLVHKIVVLFECEAWSIQFERRPKFDSYNKNQQDAKILKFI